MSVVNSSNSSSAAFPDPQKFENELQQLQIVVQNTLTQINSLFSQQLGQGGVAGTLKNALGNADQLKQSVSSLNTVAQQLQLGNFTSEVNKFNTAVDNVDNIGAGVKDMASGISGLASGIQNITSGLKNGNGLEATLSNARGIMNSFQGAKSGLDSIVENAGKLASSFGTPSPEMIAFFNNFKTWSGHLDGMMQHADGFVAAFDKGDGIQNILKISKNSKGLGRAVKSLGAMQRASAAIGVAVAGWQFGKWLNDVLKLDEKISNLLINVKEGINDVNNKSTPESENLHDRQGKRFSKTVDTMVEKGYITEAEGQSKKRSWRAVGNKKNNDKTAEWSTMLNVEKEALRKYEKESKKNKTSPQDTQENEKSSEKKFPKNNSNNISSENKKKKAGLFSVAITEDNATKNQSPQEVTQQTKEYKKKITEIEQKNVPPQTHATKNYAKGDNITNDTVTSTLQAIAKDNAKIASTVLELKRSLTDIADRQKNSDSDGVSLSG